MSRWSPEAEVDRFWKKVVRDPETGCNEWVGALSKGYGKFAIQTNGKWKVVAAHRWAWEQIIGPIPEGLVIDHICCNPACIEPTHLRVCTQAENLDAPWSQAASKRRKAQTYCKRGHEYTPENTYTDRIGRRTCRECQKTVYFPRRPSRAPSY